MVTLEDLEVREPKSPKFVSRIGQSNGTLTITRLAGFRGWQVYWIATCSCGYENLVLGSQFLLHQKKCESCGFSEGYDNPSEYLSWKDMVKRCEDPNDVAARNYKERGITICERWRSFQTFLDDMGPKPAKSYTLERINNDLGYFPENCRWATRKEQARNRRTNKLIEYRGETKPLIVWVEELGLDYKIVSGRLGYGYPPEVAFSPDPLPRGAAAKAFRAKIGT